MSGQTRSCSSLPPSTAGAAPSPSPAADGVPVSKQPSMGTQFQRALQPQRSSRKTAWADLLDETHSDNELGATPPADRKAAAAEPAPVSVAETLTQSLLIHSLSGLSATCSSSPDVVDCRASLGPVAVHECVRAASEEVDSDGTPLALPKGLPRVSVPLQPSGSRRGYAGLLGIVQSRSNDRVDGDPATPSLQPVSSIEVDEKVQDIVHRATSGLQASLAPEPAPEGMGGTYFLSDEPGRKVCIFKPCDEEPLAPNNPKQWQGRAMGAPGVKPSVRVGEAALREVAAYLLDHEGFAGVPPACLVECYHPVLNYKVQMPRIESLVKLPVSGDEAEPCSGPAATTTAPGAGGLSRALYRPAAPADAAANAPGIRKPGSLQAYAEHKCDANDMSPSHFSADNVHRIGIFDIRVLNCDRHAGNLLVQERSGSALERVSASSGANHFSRGAPYALVPIDHGYALPEALDNPYFEWLFWPQTNIPFSDEVKAYVARLDAAADAAMLREQLPALREECIRCLEVSTKVLQMCVAAGLTLFEIGSIFSREGTGDQISDLESLCLDARDNCTTPSDRFSSGDHLGSGGTTPSAPGSPVSGPLSSAFAGMSNSMLPAVEEVDSDADSACIFKLSRPGESSPCAVFGEMSPFTPPTLPEGDEELGVSTVGDWVDLSPGPHLFDPARLAAASPVPFARTPMAAGHPAAPQSASGINVSNAPPVFGQRGLMRARRNAWRTKHGGGQLPAYPPLVAASHPDQVQRVFSDLTDGQWREFMQHIEHWVASELQKGTWKASQGMGPIAGSCPVAFNTRLR